MSDGLRVYYKVYKVLKRNHKAMPQQRLATLALIIAALSRGAKCQLTSIAKKCPSKAKRESVVRRVQRWLTNEHVEVQTFYAPFLDSILRTLGRSKLRFAMDASSTARNCQTLMMGVIFQNRLLPICWYVYKGKKGHAPASLHIEALRKLENLIPDEANVELLADGEYDNIEVLGWIEQNTSWNYVIRTAKNLLLEVMDEKSTDGSTVEEHLGLKRGECKIAKRALPTKEKFGPVKVVGVWEAKYDEPIYLVTSLESADRARRAYKKRFIIKTMFSDAKGRGFGLDKSHLEDVERVERLLLGVCLAYLWMVFLGVMVLKKKMWNIVDCNRQDKSLFRLGVDGLEYLLSQGLPIRVTLFIRGVM